MEANGTYKHNWIMIIELSQTPARAERLDALEHFIKRADDPLDECCQFRRYIDTASIGIYIGSLSSAEKPLIELLKQRYPELIDMDKVKSISALLTEIRLS